MFVPDQELSVDPLRGRTIAVIGYGNQGRAHALNLRDEGLEVVVGARPGGLGEAAARGDGFDPVPVADAARAGDVVLLLLPDEVLAGVVTRDVLPVLRDGEALGVAHGSALAFGLLEVPDGHDVVLVAPTGPGVALRERYQAGEGIPAVVAVHRDVTGGARALALALATGIGCARVGVFETTVRDEAVVDLFGEQAVLCGGLAGLVAAAYETLVEAGYAPEMAYLECVHQIQLTASLVTRYGVDGMWGAISRTAAFGALEAGPEIVGEEARDAMRARLAAIADGTFFRRFVSDHERGGAGLDRLRDAARRDDMERVGRELRRRMGLEPGPGAGDAENG